VIVHSGDAKTADIAGQWQGYIASKAGSN
jgi:hypothetical protein